MAKRTAVPALRAAGASAENRIARLMRVGIALSSELDLQRLLKLIVHEARALVNCDAGSLYTVEGDHLRFRVAQSAFLGKESEATLRPLLFKIDRARIASYVALTGQVLNIADVDRLPRTAQYKFQRDVDALTQYTTRSVLAVPVKDREQETIGVLQLINALDGKGRAVPENVVPFSKDAEGMALALAAQAGAALRNAQLLQDLRDLFHGVLKFSVSAVDSRDPSTAGHTRRVRDLALRIAVAVSRSRAKPFAGIHFSPAQLEAISYAAWLHDIGKLAVPEDLLKKGGRLSPASLEAVKARFALIRQELITRALEEKVRLLQTGHASRRKMSHVEKALRSELERLWRDLAFIIDCSGNRVSSAAKQQRLAAVAKRRFVAPTGEELSCLTKDELDHLSIPAGTLTRDELAAVRNHVRETSRFLEEIPFPGWLRDAPRFASMHHEMLDGSGYPNGLKGDQIPIEARMIVIADVFDAMTAADRPFRKALPLKRALRILREEARRGRFDCDLVKLFIRSRLYRPVL